MKRVAFLDIDGVVLPFGTMLGRAFRDMIRDPYGYVEDAASMTPKWTVTHLKTFAQETDAKFVLISSWRGLFSPEHLQTYLSLIDLFDHFHADWQAPMQGMQTPRPWKARDIGEWLGDHPGCHGIVIDDEDLQLHDCGLELTAIKPISTAGFSRDDLARALKAWRSRQDLNLRHPG